MEHNLNRNISWEKALLGVLEAETRPLMTSTWRSWEEDEKTDDPLLHLYCKIGTFDWPLTCELSLTRMRPGTYQLLFFTTIAENVPDDVNADLTKAAMEINYISLLGDFGVVDERKLLYFKYGAMLDETKDIPDLAKEARVLLDIHLSTIVNVSPILLGVYSKAFTWPNIQEKGGIRAILQTET